MDKYIAAPAEQAEPLRTLDCRRETVDREKLGDLLDLFSEEGEGAFESFMKVYLASAERDFQNIRAAVAASDAASVERCAHSLRGSSANVGACRLSDVCRSLEESARKGRKDDWNLASVEA